MMVVKGFYSSINSQLRFSLAVFFSVVSLAFIASIVHSSSASAAATNLSTGNDHTCVVADGVAKCWGDNSSGKLGIGSLSARVTTPTAVTGGALAGKRVTKVSAGYNHTCAIAYAKAYCWGSNSNGQLGKTTLSSTTPVEVNASDGSALKNKEIVDISAGYDFTCAVASDGLVACWGGNGSGQLGTNNRTQRTTPTAVYRSGQSALSGKKVKRLASVRGAVQTMCAITTEDKAVCWGENDLGQAGSGSRDSGSATKGEVKTGRLGNCSAVYNNSSMKGNMNIPYGETTYALVPTSVYGDRSFESITIFLFSEETEVKSNGGKMLVRSENRYAYSTGKLVGTGAVYWGGSTTFENTVLCDAVGGGDSDWRGHANSWRIYDKNPDPSGVGFGASPMQKISGNGAIRLFCAVLPDNAAYCDARQSVALSSGQTGSNYVQKCVTTNNSWGFPVTTCEKDPKGVQRVYTGGWLGDKTISAIDTGFAGHTCVIANGEVGCWGSNARGQLGTGDTVNKNVPTKVNL